MCCLNHFSIATHKQLLCYGFKPKCMVFHLSRLLQSSKSHLVENII